jgi:RNA polymerase sigma-70 factor (ECF subfamily)
MNTPTSVSQWLEKVFDETGAQILGYLRIMLQDQHCAEDVMQNVFCKLLRARIQEKRIENLRAFVFTVARHEALREIGRRRPQFHTIGESDKIFEPESPLDALEAMCLEEAILALPPEQREVIYLKIYADLTFEEIGKSLGISQNTAASRYRYALEKMRDFLGADDET